MNSRRVADLGNEEFTVMAHYAPFALFMQARSEPGRDPRHLSRLATLHAALGNHLEAFDTARLALKQNPRDAYDRVRAHITCGTFGSLLFLDTALRAHFFEAIGIIAEAGLAGSDLHVATMINWGCSQSPMRSGDVALRTFDEAEDLAAALPKEWPLRAARLQGIEVNRMLMLLPTADQPEWLFHQARTCERESLPDLAGLCHLHLSQLLSQSDLYTAAIHHATRAGALFEAANLPHKAREARLRIARLWFNLGLRDEGAEILAEPGRGAENLGSSWRLLEADRLILEGDQLMRVADFEASLGRHEKALEEVRGDLRRAPGTTLNGPLLEICIGAILACGIGRLPERRDFWIEVLKEFADQLDSPTLGVRVGDLLRGFAAFLMQEEEIASEIFDRLIEEFQGQGLPVQLDFAELQSLLDQMASWFGEDESGAGDLLEYWDHVVHLVGEDDETVRAAYRRANVLPVLHRLLSRGLLTPWQQFEAVELARWGSLAGGLGAPIVGPRSRISLRQAFLQDSAQRRTIYPSSLGRPRGLVWASLHPSAHGAAGDANLDLSAEIAAGDWVAEPEILQLHLRNDRLYTVRIDSGTGAVTRETQALDEATVQRLRLAAAWVSPRPSQIDLDVSTGAGLSVEAAPTVAAIRCSLGPFIGKPELARDFALQLPTASRRNVERQLRRLEVPRLSEIAIAIGHLVPTTLQSESERPLLLSVSNELAHLPLSLASAGGDRFLGQIRPLAILPPVNTIAASSRGAPNSAVESWRLLVTGNARDDLAFASNAGDAENTDLRKAFLLQDHPGAATRTATLYKGHYVVPTGTAPSLSGFPVGPGDKTLLGAHELLTNEIMAPARVGLMSCAGSGLQFPDEWGGIASALMISGSREIVAPHWPIIDSADASKVDDLMEEVLTTPGHLEVTLHHHIAILIESWRKDPEVAISPHWWSGLGLLKA